MEVRGDKPAGALTDANWRGKTGVPQLVQMLHKLTFTDARATLTAFFKLCSVPGAVRVARASPLACFLRIFSRFKNPFLRFIFNLLQRLIIGLIIQEIHFKISDLWK